MAETFPETLVGLPNITDGEIRTFDLLKNVLSNEEYIVWFEPKIESRIGKTLYPDIVIWSKVTGLIVLEIKDWGINNIVECNPNIVKLRKGAEVVCLKNPESQARDYVNNAMNSLSKIRDFVFTEGRMKGKLKFPIGYGVVFPNITRKQIEAKGIDNVIKCEILTDDEISQVEKGGNDIILVSKLRRIGNHFQFDDLSNKELDKLRAVLFPRVIIPQEDVIPEAEIVGDGIEKKEEKEVDYDSVKVLDRYQEKIALSLGSGHRIVKGTAGSGKTLLLAYRAVTLKKFMPNWKVLILCYNITLRNYIRDLLVKIGEEDKVDTKGIEVFHFHDFVYHKIGLPQLKGHVEKSTLDKLFDPKTDWEEYQNLLGSVLMKNIDFIPKEQYDAILVDECQDLTTDYLKFIVHLLNAKTDHLLIAIDPAQNLYGGKITWKSVGIKAKGRVSMLTTSYRNTKNILELAQKFNNQKFEELIEGDSPQSLFPEKTERIGPNPKLLEFDNGDSLLNYITKEIHELMNKHNYKFSDFGIIYPIKPFATLLENLKLKMQSENITFKYIDKREDRLNFKINDNSCKIINIFNVKGYEFKVVFLLNVEKYVTIPNQEGLKRNTIFVGLTRAMNDLQILAIKQPTEAKFITEIKEILKKMK